MDCTTVQHQTIQRASKTCRNPAQDCSSAHPCHHRRETPARTHKPICVINYATAGDDMEVLISSTSDEITGGGKAKGRVEIRATNIEHFNEHLALVFEMRPKIGECLCLLC